MAAWSSFGFSTPKADLLRTLSEADQDGDAELGFEEFVNMVIKSSSPMGDEISNALSEMQEVFALFDPDGDGSISGSEVAEGMEMHLHNTLRKEEVSALIAKVDKNGNAELEFSGCQLFSGESFPITYYPELLSCRVCANNGCVEHSYYTCQQEQNIPSKHTQAAARQSL